MIAAIARLLSARRGEREFFDQRQKALDRFGERHLSDLNVAGDVAPAKLAVVAVAEHNRLAVSFDQERAPVNHRQSGGSCNRSRLASRTLAVSHPTSARRVLRTRLPFCPCPIRKACRTVRLQERKACASVSVDVSAEMAPFSEAVFSMVTTLLLRMNISGGLRSEIRLKIAAALAL